MKSVTFTIDESDYKKIESQANENDRSVSAELRVIIKESLK